MKVHCKGCGRKTDDVKLVKNGSRVDKLFCGDCEYGEKYNFRAGQTGRYTGAPEKPKGSPGTLSGLHPSIGAK